MTAHDHTADVLIIGGGGSGCFAALNLARRGVRVILLERGYVGSQATGVNFGGVRQQGRHPAEWPLARRARMLWAELEALIGSDSGFVATGHLKLARNQAEAEALTEEVERARAFGPAPKWLPNAALHLAYPWLGPIALAGALVDTDGGANPRVLAPALAAAARTAGAKLYEHLEAARFHHNGAGFLVEAADERFRAPILLNVAGFGGGQVAAALGDTLPIHPLTPNMMVTEPCLPLLGGPAQDGSLQDGQGSGPVLGVVGGDVYLRQTARGNVVIGGGSGTTDAAGLWARPLAESTLACARRAVALVPALAGRQIIRSWSGMEAATPDGLPVIGPSQVVPGLLHGVGFSGHGFQLLPAVGAVLAELVLDGKTDLDLAPFAPDRFVPTQAPKSPTARM